MSDLGRLAECLVDNDPAARVRARRLRGKALVLSVVLEAALLAAMFVWPLIAPGVLTAHYIVTPAPPYSGGGPAHHLTLIKINVRRLRGARWSRRTNHRCNPRRIVHKHRGHYAFAHACRSHARRFRTWRRKRRTGPAGIGPRLPGGTGDRVIIPEPNYKLWTGIRYSRRPHASSFPTICLAVCAHRTIFSDDGVQMHHSGNVRRSGDGRILRLDSIHNKGCRAELALPPNPVERCAGGSGNVHHREFRDELRGGEIERAPRNVAAPLRCGR